MSIHRSLLVLPVALLSISATITANASNKHYISKITHVKVTPKRVYGHTTRGANVVALNGKKSLGHAMANKKGNFTIKTKKNLKKVTFKLKATKKGYISRTASYKAKVAKAKATKTVKTNKANVPVPTPTPTPKPAANKTSKDNSNSKAQQLQAAKNRVAQAQANYNVTYNAYAQVNAPFLALKQHIDANNDNVAAWIKSGDAGFLIDVNSINEETKRLEAEIAPLEVQRPALQSAFYQAMQELDAAKAALAALQ